MPTTRRRFLELAPLAGTALIAACSPAPAPAPPAPTAPAAPAPAAPAPTGAAPPPVSAPLPASTPPAAAPGTSSAPMVDEKEPQALTLSYVADASRVDKAKFPAYVAGSRCSNCALYQGTAADAAGPCPLFQGRRVAAQGWCSAWAKKA